MNTSISKSRFQKGLQCGKALWLAVHRKDLVTPPSEAQQWIFDQGTEVGRLAQRLFPGGVEVAEGFRQPAEALATTQRLLAEGVTALFEPAFEYDGVFVRVDILAAAGDGRWDLYEVKSTGSAKSVHTTDAAVQAYAVEGSGLTLRTINVVHLDTSYVYEGGEYDLERLFAVADITEAAREYMPQVPAHLVRMRALLAGPEPDVRIGDRCDAPYACDFKDYCHAFMPAQHPVTDIPRLTEWQLHALLDAGITCIADVPPGDPDLTAAQRRVVEVVRAGTPEIDAAGLADALSALTWPVYHLDFETVMPALPLWSGTRPYQAVPFQYSVHVHEADGSHTHREYLHEGPDDPRPALVARMLDDLGEGGSIAHYSAYERRVLNELATALPEFADALSAVRARLFDLESVIKRHTVHPAAAGRTSIKFVLPAWCPDLSYAGLAIADGQVASARYLGVLKGLVPPDEAERVCGELREYCGLDTYAMVRLLDELRRVAEGGHS